MYCFVNKDHTFTIDEYMDSYLSNKPGDCILYSEDGSQFKIHKELFGQTEFMRQILTSAGGQCTSLHSDSEYMQHDTFTIFTPGPIGDT